MRELEELRVVLGLPPKAQINLRPKEDTLDMALIRNPNIKIVGSDGPGIAGQNGTFELTEGHGQTLNLFYGGPKDYKVFQNFVYKINGAFKPQETKICVYVESCVQHLLFRYDGKVDKGMTTKHTFSNYVSSKVIQKRKLRIVREEEEERLRSLGELGPNDEMNQKQYATWINEGRKNKDTTIRSLFANRNLHFARRDCHPLNSRFDITFSSENTEEVNSREAKQIEESESTYFWNGGHNTALESGDGSRGHQTYRAPTAFVMMAPMSTQEILDDWMTNNGVTQKYYGPAELWSPNTQIAAAIPPSVSTVPSSTVSTSPPIDQVFPDEDIQTLMTIYSFSNRKSAIRALQQLKENDLKRKNTEEGSAKKR